MAVDTPRNPVGHEREDSDSLAVQGFFDALEDPDMAYRSVGIDDERACDPSLNPGLICFPGILTGAVDEFEKSAIAAGIAGLVGDVVIFVDLHIGCVAFAGCADRDPASLSEGDARGKDDEEDDGNRSEGTVESSDRNQIVCL